MDASRLLRCAQPPGCGWRRSRGTGGLLPHARVLLPLRLSFVDVLGFSVGITEWNSTESFWR